MENIEKLVALDQELFLPFEREEQSLNTGIVRHMVVTHAEVVEQALKELWQEMGFYGEPLIFVSPADGYVQTQHHPVLLNRLVAEGERRKMPRPGQLVRWERLEAPARAHSIAAAGDVSFLLKADMLRHAVVKDRNVIPSAPHGWLCLTFQSGWKALSVRFFAPDKGEDSGSLTLVALPEGRQNEWLAFLRLLDKQREAISRRERRGHIEVIGGNNNQELASVIRKTSFADVVLPEETLAGLVAQRRIFDKEMLRRYAALHVARLRKVLLIGPPGTGKTTLLKAEAARHAKRGGLVLYVCAPSKNRAVSSWQQLSFALRSAVDSRLPTLVLVEDFEMFVTDPQELQLVLNTLDGAATPDNPAGTLLLATSNEPEKIDARIRDRPGRIDVMIEVGLVEHAELAVRFLQHFLQQNYREEHASIVPQLLHQPGSHFREVCISAAMRAIEIGRTTVECDDLLFAHEAILHGRNIASQYERFVVPSARRRGGFFGKNA